MFENLTREELFIFAASANSRGDEKLGEEIYEEIKRRNQLEREGEK